jgi:hypothetical protein
MAEVQHDFARRPALGRLDLSANRPMRHVGFDPVSKGPEVRRRKRIAEIHSLDLLRALSVGGHSAQGTGEKNSRRFMVRNAPQPPVLGGPFHSILRSRGVRAPRFHRENTAFHRVFTVKTAVFCVSVYLRCSKGLNGFARQMRAHQARKYDDLKDLRDCHRASRWIYGKQRSY